MRKVLSWRLEEKKSDMIFSEESSHVIYKMGNLELIELRQTSATLQCPSCLKHVPEGLNVCLCVVWLRPNEDTMNKIKARIAALITPYYRSKIHSRGRKHGHNQWQKNHAKAADAKRGATWRPSLDTEQMAERRDIQIFSVGDRVDWNLRQIPRLPHHGWHHRQRNRSQNMIFMRSDDTKLQAGPLWKREDYKTTSSGREWQTEECQDQKWSEERKAKTRDDSCSISSRKLERNVVSTVPQVALSSQISLQSCTFTSHEVVFLKKFRVQTLANVVNATMSCTDNTSPYARTRTFFSLRLTFHPMHIHWLKMFVRFCVSLWNNPIRAPCHFWVFPSSLLSLLSWLRLRYRWLESDLTRARLRSGVDRLVIWPIRLQTQWKEQIRTCVAHFSHRHSDTDTLCEAYWVRFKTWEPSPAVCQCDTVEWVSTIARRGRPRVISSVVEVQVEAGDRTTFCLYNLSASMRFLHESALGSRSANPRDHTGQCPNVDTLLVRRTQVTWNGFRPCSMLKARRST